MGNPFETDWADRVGPPVVQDGGTGEDFAADIVAGLAVTAEDEAMKARQAERVRQSRRKVFRIAGQDLLELMAAVMRGEGTHWIPAHPELPPDGEVVAVYQDSHFHLGVMVVVRHDSFEPVDMCCMTPEAELWDGRRVKVRIERA